MGRAYRGAMGSRVGSSWTAMRDCSGIHSAVGPLCSLLIVCTAEPLICDKSHQIQASGNSLLSNSTKVIEMALIMEARDTH